MFQSETFPVCFGVKGTVTVVAYRQRGVVGVGITSYRVRRRYRRFFSRGAQIIGWRCNLTSKPKHDFPREQED